MFTKEQLVMCSYGRFFYKGKIIEVDTNNRCYRIHYSGWSKHTDEKVIFDEADDRLQPYTEAANTIAKAIKTAKEAFKGVKVTRKRKQEKPNRNAAEPARKRGSEVKKPRKQQKEEQKTVPLKDDDVEVGPPFSVLMGQGIPKEGEAAEPSGDELPSDQSTVASVIADIVDALVDEEMPEAVYYGSVGVRLPILLPKDLFNLLREDNEKVVRQNKILTLPARTTVKQIMKDFCDDLMDERFDSPTGITKDQLKKNSVVLKEIFEDVVRKHLLYECTSEAAHYEANMRVKRSARKKTLPSEVYGYIHFVRMMALLDAPFKIHKNKAKESEIIGMLVENVGQSDNDFEIAGKMVRYVVQFLDEKYRDYRPTDKDYEMAK